MPQRASMLEVGHARSFIAVAEEMHFGRAAVRLNLTQSPLSRQIQMLQQSLGVTLLERTTRAVRLTPAGRTFLAEAYRVVAAVESAVRLTRRTASGESGTIRLSFTAASGYRTLPRIVAHSRASLPAIDLVLEEMVSDEQILALEENRIDLALLRPTPALQDPRTLIGSAVIARQQLLLAAAHSHPLASGNKPALADLDGEALVTWPPRGGRYFNDLLDNLFNEAGIRPKVVQRVNQLHAILALVGAEIGPAFVPESALNTSTANIVLRRIATSERAEVEFLLAWRQDNSNPFLSSFRDVILNYISYPTLR